MLTSHLARQLDIEISDTVRRLAFWRQQLELQAGTELAHYVREIVDGYVTQLARLEEARASFDV